jgi:hypothetical protein
VEHHVREYHQPPQGKDWHGHGLFLLCHETSYKQGSIAPGKKQHKYTG